MIRLDKLLLLSLLLVVLSGCNSKTDSTNTQQPDALETVQPGTAQTQQVKSNPNKVNKVAFSYLTMIDQKNGWGASHDLVWRTSDGGETWAETVLPDEVESIEIYASTADQLWMFSEGPSHGRRLFLTEDGGQNWVPISSRSTVIPRTVSFDEEHQVWLTGDENGSYVIDRSETSGESWMNLYKQSDQDA